MNATQYNEYLRTRKDSLELKLKNLSIKFDQVNDSVLHRQGYALDCISMRKVQHSLVLVSSELARLKEPAAVCKRCGSHIPQQRQQALNYTLFCRACAN